MRNVAVTKRGDSIEHVADALAERAVAATGRANATDVAASAGRTAEHHVPVEGVVPAGGGRPLDPSVRTDLERAFRHDFTGVRVHSGHVATEMAQGFGARAYTFGRHIVLGRGESVHGHAGRCLLAHELAHVVQYDASGRAVIARQEKPGSDGRTDSQIRSELERRTGKTFNELVLGLGRGTSRPHQNLTPGIGGGA
ncbi:eCIS core domain-containing protein [Streptomyces sp. NBC_01233]|uniref:eCIS core domain-containing protein n=1 Tax=Streptomyces sp. NBC_01233 TaxID=2903787 RepID=UPI003FA34557